MEVKDNVINESIKTLWKIKKVSGKYIFLKRHKHVSDFRNLI